MSSNNLSCAEIFGNATTIHERSMRHSEWTTNSNTIIQWRLIVASGLLVFLSFSTPAKPIIYTNLYQKVLHRSHFLPRNMISCHLLWLKPCTCVLILSSSLRAIVAIIVTRARNDEKYTVMYPIGNANWTHIHAHISSEKIPREKC